MRPRRLLPAFALAMSVLAGCGDETVTDPGPEAGGPSASGPSSGPSSGPLSDPPADVRVVGEDEARLQLFVSNQSFVDDPVRITVSIDGIEVVDQEFVVEGQHTWVSFPLALPPGRHELVATSGTGARLTEQLRTGERRRYAVINYWNYQDEDGRFLDWRIQDEPVAFA